MLKSDEGHDYELIKYHTLIINVDNIFVALKYFLENSRQENKSNLYDNYIILEYNMCIITFANLTSIVIDGHDQSQS